MSETQRLKPCPFDPTQEGWKGWERHEWAAGYQWAETDGPACVSIEDGWLGILMTTHHYAYDGKPLPHATVVSILLSNGYDPEVGP